MEMRTNYIVNEATSLIYPEYDERGNLCSVVMEDGELFRVVLRPTQLIDYSLRCHGSSLRGANDGSRMLMGEIQMQPIVLNGLEKLYWFPSMSPIKEACVWISLLHIKKYESVNKKQTKIKMNNDNEFILDVSYYSLDKKIKRAHMLKHKIESFSLSDSIFERKNTYVISKIEMERNYRILGSGKKSLTGILSEELAGYRQNDLGDRV